MPAMRARLRLAGLAGEFDRDAAAPAPAAAGGRSATPRRSGSASTGDESRRRRAGRRARSARGRRPSAARDRSRACRPCGRFSAIQASRRLARGSGAARRRRCRPGAHRKRVAAVDEDRRAVGQHDGEAGRAAEAGAVTGDGVAENLPEAASLASIPGCRRSTGTSARARSTARGRRIRAGRFQSCCDAVWPNQPPGAARVLPHPDDSPARAARPSGAGGRSGHTAAEQLDGLRDRRHPRRRLQSN